MPQVAGGARGVQPPRKRGASVRRFSPPACMMVVAVRAGRAAFILLSHVVVVLACSEETRLQGGRTKAHRRQRFHVCVLASTVSLYFAL